MTGRTMFIFCIVGLAVSGCRAATRLTEVPRVDLKLEAGNRGYLVGTPPDAGEMNATRQIVAADIEIPSFYKPKRGGAGPVDLGEMAPPEMDTDEADATPQAQRYDSYTAQKGDSLWSIAAKPEIYGKATWWRRIYEANRDQLKSPDALKAGMVLKIPRGDDGPSDGIVYEDEGVTYKK